MVVEYSREMAFTPGTVPRIAVRSSSRTRMRRPLPRPSYGIEVSPGQAMTMRSPRPAVALMSCLCSPVPKASIRLIATVPQTMPKIVRKVRSFSALRSRASCLKTSLMDLGDFFRRPFDQLLSLRQSRHDLDIQSVRDAGLDVDFLRRFRIGSWNFHRRCLATVGVRDETLRNHQDVFLLTDDDVRVC